VPARNRSRPDSAVQLGRHRLGHRPDTLLADEPTPYTNRVSAVADRGLAAHACACWGLTGAANRSATRNTPNGLSVDDLVGATCSTRQTGSSR
jgi:hypothetical protein